MLWAPCRKDPVLALLVLLILVVLSRCLPPPPPDWRINLPKPSQLLDRN